MVQPMTTGPSSQHALGIQLRRRVTFRGVCVALAVGGTASLGFL